LVKPGTRTSARDRAEKNRCSPKKAPTRAATQRPVGTSIGKATIVPIPIAASLFLAPFQKNAWSQQIGALDKDAHQQGSFIGFERNEASSTLSSAEHLASAADDPRLQYI
jgi:hypothetical protein